MIKFLKILGISIVVIFALVGLLFSVVFLAMNFGLLNVKGSIQERNKFFLDVFLKNDQIISDNNTEVVQSPDYSCADKSKNCLWNETREWKVVAGGLTEDSEIIMRVANETGVSARLIASVVVPEQIRFFTSDREVFKRYFEPLKILGSLSKFSLGVSGIKQDTATDVEKYANDSQSVYYPGERYGSLIAYPSSLQDHEAELFKRLTNDKDHYYSYLYTAIFIKEITEQWRRAGFDIEDNPAIVATLFNLGFKSSVPKSDPQVGGAIITVGGKNYTFGSLAGSFYNSVELSDIFIR